MDRTTAIRQSLAAFNCGLLGIVPVIGLIPSILAMVYSTRVRRNYRDWNPAARYLKWGSVLGGLGVLNSLLALLVIGIGISESLF